MLSNFFLSYVVRTYGQQNRTARRAAYLGVQAFKVCISSFDRPQQVSLAAEHKERLPKHNMTPPRPRARPRARQSLHGVAAAST